MAISGTPFSKAPASAGMLTTDADTDAAAKAEPKQPRSPRRPTTGLDGGGGEAAIDGGELGLSAPTWPSTNAAAARRAAMVVVGAMTFSQVDAYLYASACPKI